MITRMKRHEAAAYVARLEAENRRLRIALRAMSDAWTKLVDEDDLEAGAEGIRQVREALEQKSR